MSEYNQDRLTQDVVDAFAKTPDPRLRQLMTSLVKHIHAFACEVLVATAAVRNIIRENQLHMLQNVIETGRKDGMVSMDQTLQDLYKKGLISYDAAVSRAKNPDRFTRKSSAGMATFDDRS